MHRSFLLNLVIFFVGGCSSIHKPKEIREGMDINSNLNTSSTITNVADPARPVGPEAVFNWQKHFKSAPSITERSRIQLAIQKASATSNVPELIQRGRNEFSLGLIESAERSFRQALRNDPDNIDALIELALTLQRQRKIELSLDVLATTKKILIDKEVPDPANTFKYRYTLALAYLANHEQDKAHKILSDLIGQDRAFVPGYAALAFSYLSDGKDNLAQFIVEQAMDRAGDHASLYNILGLIAERKGDNKQARQFYNRALLLSDSYVPALVNRANLYVTEGVFSMAENDYKEALIVDPVNIDAIIGMAVLYRRTGRYVAAKNSLLRVIELDPENPNARFNLAILMREHLKDEGLALRYFNEVTQSDRASLSLKEMARMAIEELRGL